MNQHLTNSYAELPDRFFARVDPTPAPAPTLLAWNESLAIELGLADVAADNAQRAQMFSGNRLPAGAVPVATAYAGHQFGHFVPQLGDGRAVLLGDVCSAQGQRCDVQLKGAGRTPFSRGGDGKSSLGPVIREYVVSEAMHALGVPTTRALAAVATGDIVHRETALPGGVLTRVADSHIRIGSFEYFAVRGDVEAVKILADFAIARHKPSLANEPQPYVALFTEVMQRQVALIAQWMSVGFIHGVMNTDNMTISGQTLDYGPCAFMDEYVPDKVFSSIDHHARYAFDQQAPIVHWNLTRLAECLLLLDEDQSAFVAQLDQVKPEFERHYHARMAAKLGLDCTDAATRAADADLIREWLDYLHSNELDFTASFRALAGQAAANAVPKYATFEEHWRRRVAQQAGGLLAASEKMLAINPVFIPRNHQIERAISAAVQGDYSVFDSLNKVLSQPFVEQPAFSHYADPPEPGARVTQTFCGT